jgi:hypothetical protein
VLQRVKVLLHDDGMTIRGVQKLYREQGLARILGQDAEPATPAGSASAPTESRAENAHVAVPDKAGLRAALAAVEAAKRRLDAALGA